MAIPDNKELSDYFFNRCTPETAERVERWFRLHGKSDEASSMLYRLWNSVEASSDPGSDEDVRAAFEEFRSRLSSSEMHHAGKRRRRNPLSWISRAAAVLFIPLAAFSIWQAVSSYNENNVSWTEMRAEFGETGHFSLPDGTSVWLNSGSSIIYPEHFYGGKRQVFFSGEGYFDVAQDRRRTFEILVGNSAVRVLGTEFNLKSYEDDDRLELNLLDGRVVFWPDNREDEPVSLVPGEALEFDRESLHLRKYRFDIDGYSSWKDGNLYFKNCPLSEIVRQLERKFGVEMVIMTDSLRDIPYHMAFVNNESLDDILSVLDKDPRIFVEKDGNTVKIY